MTKRYARIVDGAVFETIDLDVDISEAFAPELAKQFVVANPSVFQGMTYSNSKFGGEPLFPVTQEEK